MVTLIYILIFHQLININQCQNTTESSIQSSETILTKLQTITQVSSKTSVAENTNSSKTTQISFINQNETTTNQIINDTQTIFTSVSSKSTNLSQQSTIQPVNSTSQQFSNITSKVTSTTNIGSSTKVSIPNSTISSTNISIGNPSTASTKASIQSSSTSFINSTTGVISTTKSQTFTQFISTLPVSSSTIEPTKYTFFPTADNFTIKSIKDGDYLQAIDVEITLNSPYSMDYQNNQSVKYQNIYKYLVKNFDNALGNLNFNLSAFNLVNIRSGSVIADIEMSFITNGVLSRCFVKKSMTTLIRNTFPEILDIFIKNIDPTTQFIASTSNVISSTTNTIFQTMTTSNKTFNVSTEATPKSGQKNQLHLVEIFISFILLYFKNFYLKF